MIDALLSLFNINTALGEPLRAGWPMREGTPLFGAVHKGAMIESTLVSIVRLLIGFAISVLLGAILGLLMWSWRFLDELLGPVFLGLQTLPSVCWVPLGVLLFGLRETGVLFVLIMGSTFAFALALRDGLRMIPPIYRRAGLMLGASGWRQFVYVLLPASMPAVASSLRLGFSFAWRSLMGAELIFATQRHGLGHLLEVGRSFADVAQVVAVMLVMILIGAAVDKFIFAPFERRTQRRFGLHAAE